MKLLQLQVRRRRQVLVLQKMDSTRFRGRTFVVEEVDMKEVDVVAAVVVGDSEVVVDVVREEEEAGVVVVIPQLLNEKDI